MSATKTHSVLTIALTQIALACVVQTLHAAAPASTPAASSSQERAVVLKPTSQADADLMLRQARSAIENGRLDEAEKILTRIESAHVNYSVFHVGPTPASVRRELTRAQRSSAGTNKPAGKPAAKTSGLLPFSRGTSAKTNSVDDPFAARAKSTTNQTAAAPNNATSNAGASITAPPVQSAAPASPVAKPNGDNPYAVLNASAPATPTGAVPAAGNSLNSLKDLQYPVTQTAAEDNPFRGSIGDGPSQQLAPNGPTGLLPPHRDTTAPPTAASPANGETPKQQAMANLSAARKALETGNVELAEKLAHEATSLGVPESEFLPNEDRPSLVAWEIARTKQRSGATQASAPTIERLPATNSRYDATPSDLSSRYAEQQVPAEVPASNGPRMLAAPGGAAPASDNSSLRLASAPQSLNTTPGADDMQLPPPADEPAEDAQSRPSDVGASSRNRTSLIDTADQNQQALARQLSAEIGKRQTEAQRLTEKDPERAIAILHEAQQLVKDSKLPESSQRELLSRIDITLQRSEAYANDHKGELELDKQNEAVMAAHNRDVEMKLKLQQKIADMVEEFNRLRDEQRYNEMEIIARRLNELAPDDPVAQQVWLTAKFIRREMLNRQLSDNKENSYWEQMHATETSSVNPVAQDGHEVAFDQKYWGDFVQGRKGSKDRVQRRTDRELEIERRLKTPVLLKYDNTPLSEVVDGLSELTGVNIHLDPRGLTQEGLNSDTPVTINLTKEISLKSALNLILEPLHLSYVINDEVLKVTSEQLRDGQVYAWTYNVADLVTPIPNFVPSNNIGLQGLINEAQTNASMGRPTIGQSGPSVLVNDRNQKQTGPNGDVLAQQFNAAPGNGMSPSTVPIGAGPGGMGAGANADFDSLIDLIVSTVSTDTWAENGGGEAEIRPFPTNLSLVVSQTQAVHEEIADLLQQLRRLQDLQVTIEVRFIRLNDSFFERIGVDFDMDINDSGVSQATRPLFQPDNPEGRSNTVGLLQAAGTNVFPNYTTDLDIPFRQDSFNLTQVVPFGGPVGGGMNFGFAILSDIEAYFLIEAAQGDRRTNVLNAPKVTLFNGQQAFVADATQRPFVVGVIPVVGEFAAAQQPVIVVLNEGTMMTIQAVVSDDRRYVRMTIVPFFTQIGDVDEFTFEGSSSTTSSSSTTDDDDDGKIEKNAKSDEVARSGVTVQLPSLSFVSVVTTVSVPDGGTVLLGGIKRLSEGRNEFGVPLLSKVPYINRLFRNVSIGRETDSLMMMVTPRIIIQEEEEERLGIAVP